MIYGTYARRVDGSAAYHVLYHNLDTTDTRNTVTVGARYSWALVIASISDRNEYVLSSIVRVQCLGLVHCIPPLKSWTVSRPLVLQIPSVPSSFSRPWSAWWVLPTYVLKEKYSHRSQHTRELRPLVSHRSVGVVVAGLASDVSMSKRSKVSKPAAAVTRRGKIMVWSLYTLTRLEVLQWWYYSMILILHDISVQW